MASIHTPTRQLKRANLAWNLWPSEDLDRVIQMAWEDRTPFVPSNGSWVERERCSGLDATLPQAIELRIVAKAREGAQKQARCPTTQTFDAISRSRPTVVDLS